MKMSWVLPLGIVFKIGIGQVDIQGMMVITIIIRGAQGQGEWLAEGLIALMFEQEARHAGAEGQW
jgi:hypothetical protein